MTVCKFWLQGNCKFGDRCRFEHTNRNQQQSQPNRFGALSGGRGGNELLDKYNIDLDNVEKDLTSEVPQWILSAYAPGRGAPQQLFGGYPREQSFEEMRLHFLEGKASGNEQAALNQAQELYADAQKQMENAVRNLKDAVNFVVSAEDQHPNRIDICREGTQGAPFGEFVVGKQRGTFGANSQPANLLSSTVAPSPFGSGGTASSTGSAFGQPSTMGAKPNPFGTPAFGQPAQATSGNAFGQPSQPSAFGQPSSMGAKPNPFGTPAFGQPASATQGNAFGQPSQSQGSAFGQPSQNQGSAFGQPSQAQGSAFGQPSQMGAKPNPFASGSAGASPFASAGNNASGSTEQKPNPFASNQNQNQSSPFGSVSNNNASSPFGQQAPQKPNPFASNSQPTANPFASTPNQNNAFAQASQPGGDTMQIATPAANAPQSSPFASTGQNSGGAFAQQSANPFASSAPASQGTVSNSTNNPYPPESTKQHPNGYISKDNFGNLSAFKGQQVVRKDGKVGVNMGGMFAKICFPDGPPAFNKDTALPLDAYDEDTLRRWKAFEAKGNPTVFEDGVMPELPPPREVTVWDF